MAIQVRQSTLSRAVASLENELGVSVLERSRIGVRLTNAGQLFIDSARRVIAEADIAQASARAAGKASTGSLCVGVVASIASGRVRQFLKAWVAEHPAIVLDFVEASPGEHVQALLARRRDVVLLAGQQTFEGCDTALLCSEQILVALADQHRLANEDLIPWSKIGSEHFIVSRSAPGPEIHDYVVKNLSGLGQHPNVTWHAVGRETLIAMVGIGTGISLVSTSEAGVLYPGVRFVPLEGERLPFSMVWSPRNDNPALRQFLSAARAHARAERERDAGSSRRHDPLP